MTRSSPGDLGRDSIGRLLFKLAVPSITAQLVNMMYNIVDRIYIGHIPVVGETALTGVGVTFPIIMIISAFSSLIGMGGAPLASIKMGQQDDEGAEKVLGNCFVSLLGIAAVLTALFLFFNEPLLMLFGASNETGPYGKAYLDIYVCGTVFVQLALGLNVFISAQGFAMTSMATVLIGALANIILDPILIFGFGMGVQGAALATILSQALSAAWVLYFLLGKKTKLKLRRRHLRPSGKVLLPVLALGVSPFIMQSTESLVIISLNSSLQAYGGDSAVGAMAILSSLMQVLSMPLTGLTQGAQPIIGYNYGARNNDRVWKTFRLLLLCSVTFSTLFWLMMMICPQVFAMIFSNSRSLVKTAARAARIYMAGAFMIGVQTSCQQTFLAVGQAKVSLCLALLRKIVLLIPLIYILPLFFADKVFAVYLAEPVADILAACTTLTVFLLRFRKILAANAAPPAEE